jgi:hypothetical protein
VATHGASWVAGRRRQQPGQHRGQQPDQHRSQKRGVAPVRDHRCECPCSGQAATPGCHPPAHSGRPGPPGTPTPAPGTPGTPAWHTRPTWPPRPARPSRPSRPSRPDRPAWPDPPGLAPPGAPGPRIRPAHFGLGLGLACPAWPPSPPGLARPGPAHSGPPGLAPPRPARRGLVPPALSRPSALRPPPCTTSFHGTNESPDKVPETQTNPCERAIRTDCPETGTPWAEWSVQSARWSVGPGDQEIWDNDVQGELGGCHGRSRGNHPGTAARYVSYWVPKFRVRDGSSCQWTIA